MPTKFILDKPNTADPTHIFLMVTLDDGRLKYSVKRKILPALWDNHAQRPLLGHKDQAIKRELTNLHNRLSTLDLAVKKYLLDVQAAGGHSLKAELSARLDKITKPEKVYAPKKKGFFEELDGIVARMRAGEILTPRGNIYSPATIKSIAQSVENLRSFQNSTGERLAFDTISMDTYRRLVNYFNHEKNYAINSLGGVIKNLKTFMRIAEKDGLHHNPIYRGDEFKAMREETPDIYLPDNELDAIYAVPLTGLMDRVRDWFLIDCYTGLRISDIQGLKDENIQDWSLVSVNDKTGERVVIPIHSRARAILAKYGGKLPAKTADQVINRYIKDIAKEAGLTGRVDYVVTKGGVRKEFVFQKWQMVSNHTARRTFITNLLKAGVEMTSVMHMTGIKKHSTLMRYNKRTVDETAEIMRKHDYFK